MNYLSQVRQAHNLHRWRVLPQKFGASIYRNKLNKYCFSRWAEQDPSESKGNQNKRIHRDFITLTDQKLYEVDLKSDQVDHGYLEKTRAPKEERKELRASVDLCILSDSLLYLYNDKLVLF